jgi:hypothetical protein
MALVDVRSYAKDLPRWNYDSLTTKIVGEMNAGHIVAWGCPGMTVQVRITRRPLAARARARVVASMRARLVTAGELCLAGYTSITMCAQFSDHKFPQPADDVVRVDGGTYDVDVHRLFAHTPGAQGADEQLPTGDHYVVVLTPAAMDVPVTPHAWVPWAPT